MISPTVKDEDVSVVGFNGLDVGDICRVPLTTMVQPVEAVARQAVKRLLARFDASDEPGPDPAVVTHLRILRSPAGGCRCTPIVMDVKERSDESRR